MDVNFFWNDKMRIVMYETMLFVCDLPKGFVEEFEHEWKEDGETFKNELTENGNFKFEITDGNPIEAIMGNIYRWLYN